MNRQATVASYFIWFLPQIVGLPQRCAGVCRGRLFDAAEGLAGRLISEVLAPDALLPRARAIVLEVAENTAPASVALTRQMLWRFADETSPTGALAVDGRLETTLGRGADVREGVTALLEKVRRRFRGACRRRCQRAIPGGDA